jgi:hypothetical protein
MVYYEYKKDRAYTDPDLEAPGCDNLSWRCSPRCEGREDPWRSTTGRALEDAPNRKTRVISEYELWRTALIAGRAARSSWRMRTTCPTGADGCRPARRS